MSLSTIRAGLKTKLEAVTGIANVMDYIYWTDDWHELLTYFTQNGRPNNWQIAVGNSPAVVRESEAKTMTWLFNLFGIYAVNTDTESSKTFEGICENILLDFSNSFNILSLTGVKNDMPSLIGIENNTWSNFPVHRAQLQITFTETIDNTILCQG